MNKNIKTNDKEHRIIILDWLISKGFLWHGGGEIFPQNGTEIEKIYPFKDYPYICIDLQHKYLAGNNEERISFLRTNDVCSVQQIYEIMKKGVIQQ